MTKRLLWLVIVMLLNATSALRSQLVMTVYREGHQLYVVSTDSIARLSFTGDSSQMPQYFFQLHSDTGFGSRPLTLPLSPHDSVRIEGPQDDPHFVFYKQADFGLTKTPYLLQELDSLTLFAPFFPLDTNSAVTELSRYYRSKFGLELGYFHSVAWKGDEMIMSDPVRIVHLDSQQRILKDTATAYYGYCPTIDDSGQKVMLIFSHSLKGISIGDMVEYNLLSGQLTVIDSTHMISNAHYWNADSIVYYSYGSYSNSNPTPADAGFYLYDRNTRARTFLFHTISDLGPDETVKSFDLDRCKGVITYVSAKLREDPKVINYALKSHVSDTLDLTFDTSHQRPCLWISYNKACTKLLYSNYPQNAIGLGYPGEQSELGMLNVKTGSKVRLKPNPTDVFVGIALFPIWSDSEREIAYSLSSLDTRGMARSYRICILNLFE